MNTEMSQLQAARIKAEQDYWANITKASDQYWADLRAAHETYRLTKKTAEEPEDQAPTPAEAPAAAQQRKLDEHLRMAGDVYRQRIIEQDEADAARRTAEGIGRDGYRSILD